MKNSHYHARVHTLSMDDAATRFRALSLPANYPSFAFVHGFLCSVTTTPSLIVPAEWSESLHDGIHFNSRAQLDSLFDVLVPLTNSLLTEIHTGQLHIPPCIAQSDMSLDSWDQFVDWSRGFSVAHQEFHHLWDFVLSELEEKAEHTRALGDELWEQLNLNWFGLGAPADAKKLAMLQASPGFSHLEPQDLRIRLLSDHNTSLRFLGKTCERILEFKRHL